METPKQTTPQAAQAALRESLTGERIPFGTFEKKLDVHLTEDQKRDYHYYIFNDHQTRLARAQQAGYQFVEEEDVVLNDAVVAKNSDLGTKVRFIVGVKDDGSPMYAYLMRLPMKYFLEDQAKQQQQVDVIDEAIGRGVSGQLLGKNAAMAYVPEGGISRRTTNAVPIKT